MRTLKELNGALILSEEEIEKVLSGVGWKTIIKLIAETFTEEAIGNTISPPKIIMDIKKYNNDYRVMPSYMHKYPDFCGTKIIASCPDNPSTYGKPGVGGMYVLNDASDQKTLMISGANTITAYRTAAATAVAVRELTKDGNIRLGIIGCGYESYYHYRAIESVRHIIETYILSKTEKSMKRFFDTWPTQVIHLSNKKEIFKECDVVVTLTPTTEPHIFSSDIPDREMLICGVGGDSEHKVEMEPKILERVDHFCDSYNQVLHTGIIRRALKLCLEPVNNLKSLGDLMIGKAKLEASLPIKMFLSTGVALEDLALARLIYTNSTTYLNMETY